jgi:hypothetical protein
LQARVRRQTVPFALGVLAFAFALAQRPGWSSSDTKIDLHTDPVRFLGEIASLWTPSSGLGGVESAQYAGYLFPMGPFFALAHLLGVSDWLADRLWLGLLLAVGCWGMVRLAERLGAATSPVGAEPLRRRLRQPHVDHAAGVCAAAVARVGGAPGPA